jgi:hypothetical protein
MAGDPNSSNNLSSAIALPNSMLSQNPGGSAAGTPSASSGLASLAMPTGRGMANSGIGRYMQGTPTIARTQFVPQTYTPQALSGGLFSGLARNYQAPAAGGGSAASGSSGYSGSSSGSMPSSSGSQSIDDYLNSPAREAGIGWDSSGALSGLKAGLVGGPAGGILGALAGGFQTTPASSDTNAEAAASETASLANRYPAPATPTYAPVMGQVMYQPGTDPRGYSGNVTYGNGITGYRNSITGEVTSYNPATHNSSGQYIGSIDYSSFRADDPYRNPGYYGGDEGE